MLKLKFFYFVPKNHLLQPSFHLWKILKCVDRLKQAESSDQQKDNPTRKKIHFTRTQTHDLRISRVPQ